MLHITVTLLIIDDNSTDRENYTRILKKSTHIGFHILEAGNAKEAIDIIANSNIDCILLDYILPDKNGLELLKEIREKFGDLIPVIMLTGHGDENIAVSAMKEGAADYLVKDKIESELLTKTIINAIKSSRLKKTIQEQKERLKYYAYYDSLTGLINRHTFEELVNQAIVYEKRHHDMLSIIFLDLDYFMTINDTLGQMAGDDILIETANRLKQVLPDDAIVARWGDDEFAVLITGADIEKSTTSLAENLMQEIKKPVTLTGDVVNVSVSMGIACYPINCKEINHLLKNAYSALNHAKNMGRGIIQHFDSKMG